jgi:hypothetical protein
MNLGIPALTYRIQRFETTFVVGAAVLSVLVSAIVIGSIHVAGFDRCLTDETVATTGMCEASIAPWLYRIAGGSRGLVPLFPLIAGLLVGVPIVARELESGTARLAWSLSPSRLRWFVHRAVPPLVLAGVAGLAIGLTADALLQVTNPNLDIDRTFDAFRLRGILICVQALLVASIALALGSILGRAIPTLLLGLVLFGGINVAITNVETKVLGSEALTSDAFEWDGRDLFLEDRIRMPDGQVLTYEELAVLHPEIMESGFDPEVYRSVVLYIPGERYHEIEGREAAVEILIAGLFVGLATVSVVRRRPR